MLFCHFIIYPIVLPRRTRLFYSVFIKFASPNTIVKITLETSLPDWKFYWKIYQFHIFLEIFFRKTNKFPVTCKCYKSVPHWCPREITNVTLIISSAEPWATCDNGLRQSRLQHAGNATITHLKKYFKFRMRSIVSNWPSVS